MGTTEYVEDEDEVNVWMKMQTWDIFWNILFGG